MKKGQILVLTAGNYGSYRIIAFLKTLKAITLTDLATCGLDKHGKWPWNASDFLVERAVRAGLVEVCDDVREYHFATLSHHAFNGKGASK